ncbi:MAG TPA: carboxymuconolactone decarboxylase family protein [Thermodesulfobacteriota bacterium]|nr:carboxymuconolactone decarboxylase family protein [Thermodesulfobacteriota bacterium]
MARVRYIEEETSDNPVVKEAFERMRLKRGKVTNIYKALAHKPSILAAIGPFVAAVQAPDEVDAKLKEKIILRVSKLNRSAYCCHAHEQISAKMGFTPEEIAEMDAPAAAGIGPGEKAALRYAEALTLNPGDIPEDVFTELKKHFSESQIVEITMVAALYNMVNRFNEALKLDPEEY